MLIKKDNISASGLNKLIYPNLIYNLDYSANLFMVILKMMRITGKCPTEWKEEKVIMLLKP
jgi:hypothetical protein